MTTSRPPLARLAVLDYGIGNLRSAQKAFEHVGAHAELVESIDDPDAWDGFVLPGVGAFDSCRAALARTGLDRVALDVIAAQKPFLGICIGMQLLYEGSEEAPGVAGLGVLPGVVRLLPEGVRRPQMQWNQVMVRDPGCPLFAGLGPDPWMYFVHSYAAEVGGTTIASGEYGGAFTAAARGGSARQNAGASEAADAGTVFAAQFHPEKSGRDGLALLANFARWAAAAGTATGSDAGTRPCDDGVAGGASPTAPSGGIT